jgi:glycosyltransferase involved in cell wall biosynthesis
MGKRVLYLLHQYPQASQTYVENELRALGPEFEPIIVAAFDPDEHSADHLPFRKVPPPEIAALIDRERPDLIHTHWMLMAPIVGQLSRRFGIPFTVRAHSFDSLVPEGAPLPPYLRASLDFVNSELCRKIFCLPFTRRTLLRAGVRESKLEDYYPIVNVERFFDRSPNGKDVMNIGACLPKKKMEDFVDLAAQLHGERTFRLYALQAPTNEMERVRAYNAKLGSPVEMVPPVEPSKMLAEYKRHAWLVYTASGRINLVGWPLSVGEAMAAGVGVCVPRIRADMQDYVGDAAVLYDDIAEVAPLVRGPVAADLRERGFERCKVFDLKRAVIALERAWS